MPPPYLTDDEIAAICDPLVAPSAQRRFLERLGLIVKRKPNGKALVARAEFDRVMVGRQPAGQPKPAAQPNREALLALLEERRQRRPKRAP